MTALSSPEARWSGASSAGCWPKGCCRRRTSRVSYIALPVILIGRPTHSFRANKTYLTGRKVSAVQNAAAVFFREQVEPAFAAKGLQEISYLREGGCRTLLISGAPDFLAEPLSSFLQADFLICTRLEVVRKRFSGRIRGIHPYRIAKRQLLLDVAPRLEIDFLHSRVFANHHSDAHHMRFFGSATAVNPTCKLRRIARRGGWEVVYWH